MYSKHYKQFKGRLRNEESYMLEFLTIQRKITKWGKLYVRVTNHSKEDCEMGKTY